MLFCKRGELYEKKFLIYGGDLVNKGAQAMTYITIYELRKRYPDCEITLLSTRDARRSDEDKKKYKFNIRSLTLQTMLYYKGGFYRFLSYLISVLKRNQPDKDLKHLLNDQNLMINISGYALSSQWGFIGPISYLFCIDIMKKYNVKVVLFPQSFGPFNFKNLKRLVFGYYAKKSLQYPEVIFAREKDGYDLMKKEFNLNNVRLSTDLVLQNSEIDYSLVLNNKEKVKLPKVENGSIAIIPNIRAVQNSKDISIMDLYNSIITHILKKGQKVYILAHSTEDVNICRQIKNLFQTEENVILIDQELSCEEYSYIVRNFRYIIAARFHSIVHAYKEGKPCVALGWAIKYSELMRLFAQEQYSVDVRKLSSVDNFIKLLDDMEDNLNVNVQHIKKGLIGVQKENCFSVLDNIVE